MTLSHELATHQSQQQKLTKTLIQGIEMLQMSAVDLASYLQDSVIDNPLLDLLPSQYIVGYGRRTLPKKSLVYNDPLLNIPEKPETLQQFVVKQLNFVDVLESEYKIILFLAGNLDECGYLRITLEETSMLLGRKVTEIQDALTVLQSLEPGGIGARTLSECLLLQINRDPQAPFLASTVVERFLPELAKRQWQSIAIETKLSHPAVKEILTYVQTLDPKPGLPFAAAPADYVEADAVIFRSGKHFTARLNDHLLPILSIHLEYENRFHLQEDSEAFAYYQSKRKDARQIVLNIKKTKNDAPPGIKCDL